MRGRHPVFPPPKWKEYYRNTVIQTLPETLCSMLKPRRGRERIFPFRFHSQFPKTPCPIDKRFHFGLATKPEVGKSPFPAGDSPAKQQQLADGCRSPGACFHTTAVPVGSGRPFPTSNLCKRPRVSQRRASSQRGETPQKGATSPRTSKAFGPTKPLPNLPCRLGLKSRGLSTLKTDPKEAQQSLGAPRSMAKGGLCLNYF